jgi:hypothetical protein
LANGRLKCGACDFGGSTELVHLVGVSVSLEKNFYRLPFTPPLCGRLISPSLGQDITSDANVAERVEMPVATVRTMCGSRTGGWSLPSVMSD